MTLRAKTFGLAGLLALVAAAVVVWLVTDGEPGSGADVGKVAADAKVAQRADPKRSHQRPSSGGKSPPRSQQKGSASIDFPGHGHPALIVKEHATVPLRTSPAGKLVKSESWQTEFGSRRAFSVVQTDGKWAGVPTPRLPNGQLGWVRIDPRRVRAYSTPYEISVDVSAREASLYKGDQVMDSFPVTVGAPGADTPTGRFAVTDTFIGNLNPAYGCCALALTATQPNVPSGWIGGTRIAIHGTAGPLGVAASHGCVRAADADVRKLVNTVPIGTPVVIHE